jgi:hypothetical protein
MPRITTESTLAELRERLTAGYPLLFLRTWEERRWERLLADLAIEMDRGLVTWSQTAGWQPRVAEFDDASAVLSACNQYPPEHVFLLKDFHPQLSDPVVVRQLRDLAVTLAERRQALLLMDPVASVPRELEKDVITLALPLPGYSDFRAGLDELLAELQATSVATELTPTDEDHLIQAVLGLTFAEARKAWVRALQGRTGLDADALAVLVSEKRSLASASDLLEFHDLEAGADDVGGLDELKQWLMQRALAYSPQAREQGIPLPKGALLLGVQGCGKSLTARAAARMLSFPLVRLDMSRLLESERGQSERNLRDVLHLVESLSPVVFWLDELEKGFAGVGGDEFSDATMARIVGSFLMWMQEQQRSVFVIATANSVQNLPPEMLRRGRFDELFFVDLPNFHERHHILRIHLSKRNWKPDRFRLDELAQRTEGYSGAELEQLVSAAIIDAFGRGQVLTDVDLDRSRRQLVPLSKTMEDKIFALRQWAQDRCRRATSDNRAAQMLDEEQRLGLFVEEEDDTGELPPWATLAVAGQLKAAIVEFVKDRAGDVLLPELCAALQKHVDVSGEQGLAVRANPNTVLWLGMSRDLCEALIDLTLARRLYVHPTDPERYRRRNESLKLPVLLEPTDEKLPRPKWLPASLRTAPHPTHSSRLARLARMQLAGAS